MKLTLEDVSKNYLLKSKNIAALSNVSVTIEQGSFVALTGHSGSGKSTLLAMLGLLEVPDTGLLLVGDRQVQDMRDGEMSALRATTIGFVLQEFYLIGELTALENVMAPMRFGRIPQHQWRDRATELLARVGLEYKLEARPHELSGGQQQRICIARALANNPMIVLADEPTGNLDTNTRDEILEIFEEIWKQGRTIIVATHDPAVAEKAQWSIELANGRISGLVPGTGVSSSA